MKSHRATGRPRGRPPSLPFDLGEQVLRDLEGRVDKATLLVTPCLSEMARRLKVSRSSLKRVIVGLRNSGFIELCYIKEQPTDKLYTVLYKLPQYNPEQTPPAEVHNSP